MIGSPVVIASVAWVTTRTVRGADDDGRYRVLELELVEPSLFLAQADPGAAHRLAAALAS